MSKHDQDNWNVVNPKIGRSCLNKRPQSFNFLANG